jgi:predicted DNA-binding WGR domain protein
MDANQKKYCLIKASDGARGQDGKKKVYEITVSGLTVTMSWGMAEKPNRQTKVETFTHPAYATQFATTKVWMKRSNGYQLAYTA